MIKTWLFWILLIVAMAMSSCTQALFVQEKSSDNIKIQELQKWLQDFPNDPEALKELGFLYFKTRQYTNACKVFSRVKPGKTNGKLFYYYGLSLEITSQKSKALAIYAKYPEVGRFSRYRKKLEGRFHWLSRELIHEEIKNRLLSEQQLSVKKISPEKIAVFPFRLVRGDSLYSSLGCGIAEMVVTDLSQVDRLQLIERVRIQALMDEMRLGQSGLLKENTAVRYGKILGAGTIVHGQVALLDDHLLRLDVSGWHIMEKQFPEFTSVDGRLHHLFKLEKELVFHLLKEMDIQITPQEREKILYIPTRNLQAFLAYSRGLEKQDQGRYGEALVYFRKASRLDPGFKAVKNNIKQCSLTTDFTAGADNLARDAVQEADLSLPEVMDLTQDRLKTLGEHIGSSFVPGEETRESAQESTPEIRRERLPDPPPPPVP